MNPKTTNSEQLVLVLFLFFLFYRINVRFDSTSDFRIKQQPRITREKSRRLKISMKMIDWFIFYQIELQQIYNVISRCWQKRNSCSIINL